MPEVTTQPTTATPTPYELTLADGSVIKAANQDEAIKVMAKMKVDTANALREQREKAEQLQQQNASLTAQINAAPKPQPAKPQDKNGFDNDRYWTLLNTEPMEAQNYLDAHRFGIEDPKLVPQQFNQMRQEVSEMRQQTIAAQFYQHHAEDFPPEPQAVRSVSQRFQELVGQGFPANALTLDYGYKQLVEEGTIKPLEKKPTATTTTTTENTESANPALTGAGGAPPADSELDKFAQMNATEMEAYLRSKGMFK